MLKDLKEGVEEAIEGGLDVVQADESIFHQRIVVQKSWSNKATNILPRCLQKSEPALAVVGACSLKKGWLAHLIKRKSIRSPDFLIFLDDLCQEVKPPFALILDNASIHKTKVVREYCTQKQIKIIWNVPYSPWFNGIEEVWSLIKRDFRKSLLRQMLNQEPVNYLRSTIIGSINLLEESTVKRLVARSLRIISEA